MKEKEPFQGYTASFFPGLNENIEGRATRLGWTLSLLRYPQQLLPSRPGELTPFPLTPSNSEEKGHVFSHSNKICYSLILPKISVLTLPWSSPAKTQRQK